MFIKNDAEFKQNMFFSGFKEESYISAEKWAVFLKCDDSKAALES